MKNAIFSGNILIEYPDDYYEMDATEIKKFFSGDQERFGARNVEKHAILSVAKTRSSFLNLLTDAKSVLAGAESSLRRGLKAYRRLEEFDVQMLGKTAKGIRFTYQADNQDVCQFCEMTVVKGKRCFYVVYCVGRYENEKENEATFVAFRNSLQQL